MNKINHKYSILDITEYFNCKFILNKEDINRAKKILQFIGAHDEFFDANSLPDSNKILTVSGIPFIFPDKNYDKYDSISCEGQMINLPPNLYSGISMLITGVWGNYHERIKIFYHDDSSAHFKIDFRDWHCTFANTDWEYDKYNCTIAVEGKDIKFGVKKCIYLFKSYFPNADKSIKYIELPYNPDLYIFAITMFND